MPIPVDSSTPAPVGTLDGRLRFPATDDRLAYETHGPNLPFLSQAGKTVVIYVDAAGSILADIVNEAGAAISNSALTVDNNSQIPQFFGPVGVEVLYARLNGGTATPIYAWLQGRYNDYDAQFTDLLAADTALDSRVDTLEAYDLTLDGRLDSIEPTVVDHENRLDYLEPIIDDAVNNDVNAGIAANYLSKASAAELYHGSRTATYFVSIDGSDSAHSLGLRGKVPQLAFATVEAAATALVSNGVSTGVIEVGAGTFAPWILNANSIPALGLTIRGRGPYSTIFKATTAGTHAAQITSKTGLAISPGQIKIEDCAFNGVKAGVSGSLVSSGHGLVLGGGAESWSQLGGVYLNNCYFEGNGKDGLRVYNINNSVFQGLRMRNNNEWGIRVTNDPLEGTGVTTRGNTNIFIGCTCSDGGVGGVYFDQVGQNYTWMGGEVNLNPIPVKITNSGNAGQFTFIGAHYERNTGPLQIGDNGLAGQGVKNVSWINSSFYNNGGLDVLLDNAQQILFDGCQFGAADGGAVPVYVGVRDQGTGSKLGQVEFRACQKGAGAASWLFEDNAGVRYGAMAQLNRGGRRRLHHLATSALNDAETSLDFIKTEAALPVMLNAVETVSGRIETWVGTSAPENNITAPEGSLYRRISTAGNVGLHFIKRSGTGNTGWAELAHSLHASTTWDPPSLAPGTATSTTVTVTGATVSDIAVANHGGLSVDLMVISAYVSAADTVTVVLQNVSTVNTRDIGSNTLRVRVFKRQA